jgi:hypothetical protein
MSSTDNIVEYAMLTGQFENGDEGHTVVSFHTCKYCGEGDLVWTQLKEGWRLTKLFDNVPHTCREYDIVMKLKSGQKLTLSEKRFIERKHCAK